MNSTNCTSYGGDARSGACVCYGGWHGADCGEAWVDSNPTAWYACLYLIAGLHAGLIVLYLVSMVLYWTLGKIRFPRLNRQLLGLLCLTLSSACLVAFLVADPYSFKLVAATGEAPKAYTAGLTVLDFLGFAFLACAYGVLTLMWL
jgi:hypothetical protein